MRDHCLQHHVTFGSYLIIAVPNGLTASHCMTSLIAGTQSRVTQEGKPYPAPHALHAGTVSRAMWAFAMQGLHDDPLLPTLMPHVRVRLVRVQYVGLSAFNELCKCSHLWRSWLSFIALLLSDFARAFNGCCISFNVKSFDIQAGITKLHRC